MTDGLGKKPKRNTADFLFREGVAQMRIDLSALISMGIIVLIFPRPLRLAGNGQILKNLCGVIMSLRNEYSNLFTRLERWFIVTCTAPADNLAD